MWTGHGQELLTDGWCKEIPGKELPRNSVSDAPIKAVCNPSAYAPAGA